MEGIGIGLISVPTLPRRQGQGQNCTYTVADRGKGRRAPGRVLKRHQPDISIPTLPRIGRGKGRAYKLDQQVKINDLDHLTIDLTSPPNSDVLPSSPTPNTTSHRSCLITRFSRPPESPHCFLAKPPPWLRKAKKEHRSTSTSSWEWE